MTQIRNVAIIAHVDHGKTTLVDKILIQSNLLRPHQLTGELILDNNPLERERGITIMSKNVSVRFGSVKINIIDTPGHADFGGEVERVLHMAEGVLLLVDAFEGPMPQTRFLLEKALALEKQVVVIINKVDKPHCDPVAVQEKVFELFCSFDANDRALDFPVLFGSARQGWMSYDWQKPTTHLGPLFETIVQHIPPPPVIEGSPQLVIAAMDYSPYHGRIAIGRLARGTLTAGMSVDVMRTADGQIVRQHIKELFTFEGLERCRVPRVECGDLCALSGFDDFALGDTIVDREQPMPHVILSLQDPTLRMLFCANTSPFFGKDGRFVTGRHLWERLEQETRKNVSLRVERTDASDTFLVQGRGILHLSILIETMRREGYELLVGQPNVLTRIHQGITYEPAEHLTVNVPEAYTGRVIELVSVRRGELISFAQKGEQQLLEFLIPARGIIGLRNELLTATAGQATFYHAFAEYIPWKGPITLRHNGSLIALVSGRVTAYALSALSDRGSFFVAPGDEVYSGQIVGKHVRRGDLLVNVVRQKKLTNVRAAGHDTALPLHKPIVLTLEQCLEYIDADECVEVTPNALRLRKIILDHHERQRQQQNNVSTP